MCALSGIEFLLGLSLGFAGFGGCFRVVCWIFLGGRVTTSDDRYLSPEHFHPAHRSKSLTLPSPAVRHLRNWTSEILQMNRTPRFSATTSPHRMAHSCESSQLFPRAVKSDPIALLIHSDANFAHSSISGLTFVRISVAYSSVNARLAGITLGFIPVDRGPRTLASSMSNDLVSSTLSFK